MMGLREKKKREARARILKAAEAIFVKEGYSKATTARIAREAEVGEGTIYNYFDSKSDILIAIFQRTFEEELTMGAVVIDPNQSAETIFHEHLSAILVKFKVLNKEWMREIFAILLKGSSQKLQKGLFDLDNQMMDGVLQILKALQEAEMIKQDIDLEAVKEILYAVLMTYFVEFTIEEIDYETFCDKIQTQYKLIWSSMLAI
jgi:AcrR family transcriptional regulator